ncbi:MAG: tryptophan synthase subunit alpha [Candidatus Omnitrophota bacterium]
MNRIDATFKRLRRLKEKALVTFITAGDPDLATSEKLVREFSRQGADIVELGVPFSDPLADGPTIQASAQRALKKGVNLDAVCVLVKKIRHFTQIPIVFLTYYNIVYHYGVERFVKKAKASGADGAVIPDLPVEEAAELIKAAKRYHFATIFLLAPTSDTKRIKAVAAKSSGFIYYVSLTGTTGVRTQLPVELIGNVRKIKRITAKPVCVGFGVSTPLQAKAIARVADGVIVGSAIVEVIARNLRKRTLVASTGKFVRKLRNSL